MKASEFKSKNIEGIIIVSFKEIQKKMSKFQYEKFCKWMSGQTCMYDGVFIGDLDRFLKGLSVID